MNPIWPTYVMIISEIAAFIFAIIYWRRYRKSTERIFLFLLGYGVVTDLFGLFYSRYFDGRDIVFVYNIYYIISFSVYFYWFSLILKRKRFAYLFLTIFLLITLYSALFKSFWDGYWELLWNSGSIFTIICVGIYYLELMGLNTIFKTTRSQRFWIASGLLIYFLGHIPTSFYQYHDNATAFYFTTKIHFREVWRIIHMSLFVFLYSFYVISFICIRKK